MRQCTITLFSVLLFSAVHAQSILTPNKNFPIAASLRVDRALWHQLPPSHKSVILASNLIIELKDQRSFLSDSAAAKIEASSADEPGFLVVAQQPPTKSGAVERAISEVSQVRLRSTVEKLASFGTRHTLSDTLSEARGIGAARKWIFAEFQRAAVNAHGRMTVEFHRTTVPPSARVKTSTEIVNVVAWLRPPTRETKRAIIISGHYDSRASDVLDVLSDAPGANDDGSGTALVLELARVMANVQVERTVVFAAFAGEEQGLLGANAFAEYAAKESLQIDAVLNNDIVGNSSNGEGKTETRYVRLFSEAFSPLDTGVAFRRRIALGHENDGASRSLARYIADVSERYNPEFGVRLIYRLDRFLRGGDHRPFHQRGIAAVRFSEANENFDGQHQNVRTENGKHFGDVPEAMDFAYLANVARTNVAALATLALAPASPEGVIIRPALDYETTLSWRRNSESDLAGYVVRIRETNVATWQHSIFTSDTSVTLKQSKDDFLFGVQAVDKAGHASLIQMPSVAR